MTIIIITIITKHNPKMKRTSPESGLTTPSIAPPLLPLSQGAALVVLNGDGIILDTT
jgi:hypothetical protein